MNRAIFFDRDGVINPTILRSSGAETAPWTFEEFSIYPKVPFAFHLVQRSFLCFVVTNQPGMLDGDMSYDDLDRIHTHLMDNFPITEILYAEKNNSDWYKPNSGMITHLIQKYDISPHASYMIGDRWKDIVCGYNAGVNTIFVGHKYNDGESGIYPDFIATDILSACHLIMEQVES